MHRLNPSFQNTFFVFVNFCCHRASVTKSTVNTKSVVAVTLYFLYISILNYVFNVLLNVYYEFKENIVKISLKRILIIQKK